MRLAQLENRSHAFQKQMPKNWYIAVSPDYSIHIMDPKHKKTQA
jgi:hypothetical protein